MMARNRIGLFGLIALALAGAAEARPDAHRVAGAFCTPPQSLYRAGDAWLCAEGTAFPAWTITVRSFGTGLPEYRTDVSDVLATASCLTGARFAPVDHDAQLTVEIRRDPETFVPGVPRVLSMSHRSPPEAPRKASVFLNVYDGMHREVGTGVEEVVWTYLGISKPRLLPPVADANDAPKAETVAGAESACGPKMTLMRRDGVRFCRPAAGLPKIVRYATLGNLGAYGDAIERSIHSVAALTGVDLQASKEPDVLLVFAKMTDREEKMADVLRHQGITPSKGLEAIVAGASFADHSTFGMHGGANPSSWIFSIGLHDQQAIDVAESVEVALFDILGTERPAFTLPGECG